ncbi:MAG: hypothetical protein M3042_07655 [Actinomycetota bacterium]|nr:hypothetical protein [Actinomycetota bacterium]
MERLIAAAGRREGWDPEVVGAEAHAVDFISAEGDFVVEILAAELRNAAWLTYKGDEPRQELETRLSRLRKELQTELSLAQGLQTRRVLDDSQSERLDMVRVSARRLLSGSMQSSKADPIFQVEVWERPSSIVVDPLVLAFVNLATESDVQDGRLVTGTEGEAVARDLLAAADMMLLEADRSAGE